MIDNGFMNACTYESASHSEAAKKERIAEKAIDPINNGDVIYLDTGTAAARLAVRLADALRDNRLRDLMIFTNSLMNLNVLKEYGQVVVIGGMYRGYRKDFAGRSQRVLFARSAVTSVLSERTDMAMTSVSSLRIFKPRRSKRR